MPYYEFYNLPNAAIPGLPVPLPRQFQANPANRLQAAANPFSESAAPDQMVISVSTSANPSNNGWIGRGPEWFNVSIRRRVKTFTNAAGAVALNIATGDLPLYKLAVMSTHPNWNCSLDDPAQWPKLYLELDTQNGVRLKYEMERLVIDDWSLEVDAGNAGEVYEVLQFRAWVVQAALREGNSLKVALGNSEP
ncbi:MAG: hypothetical protein U1A77_18815 [Pirellulales bacterium]